MTSLPLQAYPLASDVMIKELQYKGYATEPSDYECPDGQLATSLNLINEDNQLKPIFQPKTLFSLPDGYRAIRFHKVAQAKHLVLHNPTTGTLAYLNDIDYTHMVEIETISPSIEVYKAEVMGNTLIVTTSAGLRYYLWKDGHYVVLGEKPKAIEVLYSVKSVDVLKHDGEPEQSRIAGRSRNLELDLSSDEYERIGSSENVAKKIASPILAKLAQMKGWAKEFHAFANPFFVRVAYRTYKGSHIAHSAPFLVCPNTAGKPLIVLRQSGSSGYYADFYLPCVGVSLQISNIPEDWKDVITAIDVFVSPQLQAHADDDKALMPASFLWDTTDSPFHADMDNYQSITSDGKSSVHIEYYASGPIYELCLQHAALKSCAELVADESRFYLVKTLTKEMMGQAHTYTFHLELTKDDYDNLTAKEQLEDDYQSRYSIVAREAYVYNSRLNIIPIRVQPAQPDPLEGYMPQPDQEVVIQTGETAITAMQVEIQSNGQTAVTDVARHWTQWDQIERFKPKDLYWFYYPDTNAVALRIAVGTKDAEGVIAIDSWFRMPLTRHPFLNGAYAFNNFSVLQNTADDADVAVDDGIKPIKPIAIRSKIYASETENPFVFLPTAMNTVGSGDILRLSAAAKALSQGQFGQFPLYAFTTEGVWALEVSSTGSYSARQPITRDVCINTDSITQIDSSVLFATDRGIMLISGSQTQCITDSIFSEAPFNVLDLPGIDQLHAKLGHATDACLPMKPFLGFLAGCQMVYDYVHQRIFVYNPTKVNGSPKYTYAYVFSLKSKMWGMVFTNLASTINAYPEALAMTLDNKLVSFSETDEQACKGLYITRPLKLEAADVQKTISTLIQRGHFQRGDVGTVLYGSRDLYKWYLIWSSKDHYLRGFRGTPYKYFRIAGLATLTDGKSIFGASVNFEPRHTNQLR